MVIPQIPFDWLLNKRTKHDVRVKEKEGFDILFIQISGYFLIEHLLVVRVFGYDVSWHEVYGLMLRCQPQVQGTDHYAPEHHHSAL